MTAENNREEEGYLALSDIQYEVRDAVRASLSSFGPTKTDAC